MERMQDLDPVETGEWVDSLRAVLHHEGSVRATYLLEMLAEEARRAGIVQPSTLNTPYVNTIPPEREERADWDRDIEHRIRSIIRWNAVAIILRANKESSGRSRQNRRPSPSPAAIVDATPAPAPYRD